MDRKRRIYGPVDCATWLIALDDLPARDVPLSLSLSLSYLLSNMPRAHTTLNVPIDPFKPGSTLGDLGCADDDHTTEVDLLLNESESMLADIATLRDEIPILQAAANRASAEVDELEAKIEALRRKANAERAAALQRRYDSMTFF